ncbi:MAG: hypothetical protein M1817_002354 [Caeruleum heppii]|nr:MAG: hypothetical protein M1817_003461 [Caeruleum heppii]KAI9673716.1 MAG: hypothetical protein M1817_002354 [Caeruleum heppii]
MADIDADLLALAGDSPSDGEEPQQGTTSAIKDEDSPASPPSSSPAADSRRGSSARPANVRKRASSSTGAGRHGVKRSRRDDSEEEGEASSDASSRSSLRSASMSESESDTDPMDSSHHTKYPIEGRFLSEADRAEIMALPEIKREEILAERATVIEREQQNRMLVQLLQDKQRKEGKESEKKKRKAGATGSDERQRKSSRQKTTLGGRKVGESSAPLEKYKRQREQRGIDNEQRRKREDGRAGEHHRSSDYSDADAHGESEVEWDDPKADARRRPSSSAARDEQPAELRDYCRARIGRTGFAQVSFYPGFEAAITGCPVRINIGVDKATGQNVYRLAQIKSFTEGKPYGMTSETGKQIVTTQYALAAHGKAQKEWPFIVCSDSDFTEAEFERYKKTCAVENVPVLTKPFLDSKVVAINALLNRSWTEEELQEKLRRSGALLSRHTAEKRGEIKRRREHAVQEGDEAAIAACDAELSGLDGPKLAFGTSRVEAPSKAPTGLTQQERLAELNAANRKANAINVRKAQLAEKRAQQKREAAVLRGEAVADPFARVKTRAKIMHNIGGDSLVPPRAKSQEHDDLFGSDISRAGTPANNGTGTNTPNKIGTPKRSGTPVLPRPAGEKKGGIPTIRSRNMDDDIIAAMDLGIEIDI